VPCPGEGCFPGFAEAAALRLHPGLEPQSDSLVIEMAGGKRRRSGPLAFEGPQPTSFPAGTMIHSFDFDDTKPTPSSIPAPAVVPPAFTLAERMGPRAGFPPLRSSPVTR